MAPPRADKLARMLDDTLNVSDVKPPDPDREKARSDEQSDDEAPPPSIALPEEWARYEHVRPLGEGGMGAVYLAKDSVLGRLVALKFLHRSEPSLLKRFLWEAQAQARIDHPNICKVYETGERAGQPFIAMQYIDGERLDSAVTKMSIEQRVQVIRDVADGLHAAHSLGLIHRDIKPANILVERTQEGTIHPYIVDFGLARDNSVGGETIFSLEGTPYYMSPEQVSGDVRALDRRTDVFSLGATLYHILTGQLPFSSSGSLSDILWKVTNEQPKPLREIDRRISVDLETIVLKCLEKEPERRYSSAKAVAEDLRRYLTGDPIEARRASLIYRARKAARKHWVIVLAGLAVLIGLALVIVTEARARIAASKQEAREAYAGEFAQDLGQDVKEIELFMRYIYALPLHDITREKEVVRERMQRIDDKMRSTTGRLGALAEGVGNYALARGYLTLRDPKQAASHLVKAIENGFATRDVMLAAGEAQGALYRQAVDQSRHLGDKGAQEAARKSARTAYLEPGIHFLRQSASAATATSPYASALIALYEERFDDALTYAQTAMRQAPWYYEMKKLEGDIYLARGEDFQARNEHDLSLSDYNRAVESYRAAQAMATSDPSLYDAEGEVWQQVLALEKPRGVDLKTVYDSAVRACDDAATADPSGARPYARKARAAMFHGHALFDSGADPRPVFRDAISAGEVALRLGGHDPFTYNTIGEARLYAAIYASGFGDDVRGSLNDAIADLKRAIELSPGSAWAWNGVAVAYSVLAEQAAVRGGEPVTYWVLAGEGLDKSNALDPLDYAPLTNHGWVLILHARWELEHGRDPSTLLAHARDRLVAASKLRPDSFLSHSNLGYAVLVQARLAELRGEGAKDLATEAIAAFNRALAINSSFVEARQGIADAFILSAEDAIERGLDPKEPLNEAQRALTALAAERPTDPLVALAQGQLELLNARVEAAKKRPAQPALTAALSALTRARSLNAPPTPTLTSIAEAHQRIAEWTVTQRRSPERSINAGRAAIEDARRIDPSLPSLDALDGALLLIEARAKKDEAAKAEVARRAINALTKALAANPLLKRAYAPLLHEAEALAGKPGDQP